MLKLIKYELLRSYRNYFMMFVIYLAVCVVLPFTMNSQFLSGILMLVFFVLVLGLSISIFISIVVDFWKSMFSREGYLTLTLPLSTAEILLAKLIAGSIWMIVATGILFLGISLLLIIAINMVGEGANLGQLFQEMRSWLSIYGSEFSLTFVLGILTFITSAFQSIIYLYTCMSAVHTKLTRTARPIIAIALYFGGSLLLSYILTMFGLNNEVVVSTIADTNRVMITNIVVSLVLSIAFFFTTAYIIDHHIELDA